MSTNDEKGFSYIEVMIAIVILMVGILGLVSAMSGAVISTRGQDAQLEARQIAASTMESVMSAKETDATRLGWDALGNVGSNIDSNGVAKGIFLTGFQNVMSSAGPDEVVGTADDTGVALSGYQRSITITDVCDPDRPSWNCDPPGDQKVKVRSVQVIVRYFVGSIQREEQINTVLTDYSIADSDD